MERYVEPSPAAVRAVIWASRAFVALMVGLPIVACGHHAYTRQVEEARMEREDARTAEEWQKAVHQWNEGAQRRRAMQAEMDQIRAEAVVAKQKQGRAGR